MADAPTQKTTFADLAASLPKRADNLIVQEEVVREFRGSFDRRQQGGDIDQFSNPIRLDSKPN